MVEDAGLRFLEKQGADIQNALNMGEQVFLLKWEA